MKIQTIQVYMCDCGARYMDARTKRGGKKPSETLAKWLEKHKEHDMMKVGEDESA